MNPKPLYWSKRFAPGTKVYFCVGGSMSVRDTYRFGGKLTIDGPRVLRGRVRVPPRREDYKNLDHIIFSYMGNEFFGPMVLIERRNRDKYERPESEVFRTRAEAERALMVRVLGK
jgi:hypothetical protein